jgi:radical SAM protein with 4Fe4S-binding SPASM domain
MKDKTIFGTNKILQHLPRINKYKLIGKTPPITIELDVINACNHKCPGCAGGREPLNAKIETTEGLNWLEQMKDYGVKAITFTGGGEPLVNKATIPLVQYAKELGFDIGFITNGSLLDKGISSKLVNYCTWIRVSLDASDSRTYKKIHGKGRTEFLKVLKNINALGIINNHYGKPCTVGVGYLTNEVTKPGMIIAAKKLSTYGVDYLQFRPFHNDVTDVSGLIDECKQFETKDFKILASTQKYCHFKDKFKRDYNYCHGANFVGVIQATGDMTICCHTRGIKKYNLGNLRNEPFQMIWEGKKKQDILKKIDVSKCVPYCRADSFNRVLYDIMTEKEHVNFL